MINPALYSSQKQEWETPQWLFDWLDSLYHFDLDPCATAENAKCKRFYTKEQDGLAQPWYVNTYVNSPYGRDIGRWVEKAKTEALLHNVAVVMLLPARTDTRWFQQLAIPYAKQIVFLGGRVQFVGAKDPAPFPSCLVAFGHRHEALLVTGIAISDIRKAMGA